MSDDLLTIHLRELPYFRALLRAAEAEFVRSIRLPRPRLDLGAGDGHFASVVFEAGVDLGVDPDAASLVEARRRGCYRLLIRSFGDHLPIADGRLASAVSNSVLEHIPDLEPVLAEVGRVLRRGATFVFTVPNPAFPEHLSVPPLLGRLGLGRLGETYRAWFVRVVRHWNMLDENEWSRRLVAAGFRVERTFRYFPPASLHALEWGHYLGAPCLLPRAVFGRWILVSARWNLWLTERLLRRYHRPSPCQDGTYSFYRARRV
jgi:SAM-dependent methyltransferase